jgi:hypothetical protein
MKKVGILLKKPENIFSNGCVQQCLFLKKILINTGVDVDFLSIEENYTKYEITNDKVIFTDDTFDFSDYFVVILGSLVLLNTKNKEYIDNLKKFNICVINLICGNVYILHQEEYIFNKHQIMHHYIEDSFTQNWLLEMYDYSKTYVELLSNKPTHITPYIWDNDIISEYVKLNNIIYRENHDTKKVNILIFEPNMSIHKSSLIPILLAEKYYNEYGNLNKVYVFCTNDVLTNSASLITNLNIYKNNIIESYGRIVMPFILNVIQDNNNFINVVISHNIMNQLNFLHLEMFHLGIPIIHNCLPYEDNGYYYNDFTDNNTIVNMIDNIRLSFNQSEYSKKCKCIIDKYSSTEPSRVNIYKNLLIDIYEEYNKEQPIIVTEQPIIVTEQPIIVTEQPIIVTEQPIIVTEQPIIVTEQPFYKLYKGEGYLMYLNENQDISLLIDCYNLICSSISCFSSIEIILHNEFQSSKKIIKKKLKFYQHFNVSLYIYSEITKIKNIDIHKLSSFSNVSYVPITSSNMEDIIMYVNKS